MKKSLFFLVSFLFSALALFSQNSGSIPASLASDTAHYPYWIEMMQNQEVNFYDVQRAFNTYWEGREITRGCGYKPFKRWEYLMQSRVRPDGSRPAPDEVWNAVKNYGDAATSVAGNWSSLGPITIPAKGYKGLGRLNAIAFHPTDQNTIYVGAPSGGFWFTNDHGQTWSTTTDNMPTLGVSSIAVNTTNPAVIYLGSGDRDHGDAPGMGVFKSTDGGLTWAPSNTGMGNKTVGMLLIHPTNQNILLAATSGGIYKSTDAGATWTQKVSGDHKDLAFKPGDPNIVYSVASGNFYRSSNNGDTWVMVTNGLPGGQRSAIAVTAANPSYVYVVTSNSSSGFKGLYRSTDSGLNFSTRSTSPNILDWSCDGSGSGGQGWYDLDVIADPVNANILFVGGVNVWKSTNGGQTWAINSHWYGGCSVPEVHADLHIFEYNPLNNKLYAGNDGGIYETSNGGSTWPNLSNGLVIGQIYKLGQSAQVKDNVITGFQDNGSSTYIGTGGWLDTGGGDGMECLFDHENPAYSYHTVYYGSVYRNYNHQGGYQVAGNGVFGINESGAWVAPFILHVNNGNTMFLGMKNIWRSTNVRNMNVSWTKISSNLSGGNNSNMAVLEQSPADKDILYAAREDKKLFRSDNCNDPSPSWTVLTTYLPAASTPTDIEAHPTDPNTVYITLAHKVYKSTNKGVTWTDISGTLPDVTYSSIAYYVNAHEGLYVAGDAGVFYKDNFLSDWVPFNIGLPANPLITEIEIYVDNDSVSSDVIRACTFGRGLWGSDMYHAVPAANFEANQTLIATGSPVNFTDLSSGVPTQWLWTFEGGTPATSTERNPTAIIWATAGTFDVTLQVTNPEGTNTLTIPDYITVSSSALPQVIFTADHTVPCLQSAVSFIDSSLYGPTSWLWAFNPTSVTFLNGTSATSQNPVVQFNEPATYDVSLTATNSNGSNTLQKPGYIASGGYLLPFSEDFEQGLESKSWEVINNDAGITWSVTTTGGTSPGNQSAWINFYNYYSLKQRDQMMSPPMNLSAYNTASLTFEHAYAQRGSLKDSLIIYISDDCGTNWTRIFAQGPDGTPNTFVTHEPTTNFFLPAVADDWCLSGYGVTCYDVNISAWAGKQNVKIMFESFNKLGNNLFLDNIMVSDLTAIPAQQTTEEITIYPNPSSGVFRIGLNKDDIPCQISVFNSFGQIVFKDHITNYDPAGYQVKMGKVSHGLYLVKVENQTIRKTQKIMIR